MGDAARFSPLGTNSPVTGDTRTMVTDAAGCPCSPARREDTSTSPQMLPCIPHSVRLPGRGAMTVIAREAHVATGSLRRASIDKGRPRPCIRLRPVSACACGG